MTVSFLCVYEWGVLIHILTAAAVHSSLNMLRFYMKKIQIVQLSKTLLIHKLLLVMTLWTKAAMLSVYVHERHLEGRVFINTHTYIYTHIYIYIYMCVNMILCLYSSDWMMER